MKKEKINSKKEINTEVISNVSTLDSKELSRIFGGWTLCWTGTKKGFVYRPGV